MDLNETTDNVKRLGQYPTAVWVAEALVERHFGDLSAEDCVIEPACGPGAFLGAIPKSVHAVGVEIDPLVSSQARKNTGRRIITGDFRTVELDLRPTAIIGNPPFDLEVIDGFLDRAFGLLPEGGKVGFILPAYAFQTASRVAGYADRWSLLQEMIPRNIYPGLKLPLVFALFGKDRRRTMVGFALYRETADLQKLPKPYRQEISAGAGPIWVRVVEQALGSLGGRGSLQDIYNAVEGKQPTTTKFWREQIRKVIRNSDRFACVGKGMYQVQAEQMQLIAA